MEIECIQLSRDKYKRRLRIIHPSNIHDPGILRIIWGSICNGSKSVGSNAWQGIVCFVLFAYSVNNYQWWGAWPRAWETPGHLHFIFNALRTALQAIPEWKDIEKIVRAVARFLSKRGLRKRFIVLCCAGSSGQASPLLTWTGGTFSWYGKNSILVSRSSGSASES